VSLLLGQPATKVGTVGLVGLPIDVVATVDTNRPIDNRAVADSASSLLDDVERALVVVLSDGTVLASSVGVENDTNLLQECVQVCGGVSHDLTENLVDGVEDVAQEAGCRGRSCCCRGSQQGSGDGDVRTHGCR
jgi:hypothetical protein